MQALKKLKAWEEFYYTVTGSHIYDDFKDFKDVHGDKEMSLETFMRKRPGKICWVDLAVAAYQCGEEEIFDQLSEKMKSPAGSYMHYFCPLKVLGYTYFHYKFCFCCSYLHLHSLIQTQH